VFAYPPVLRAYKKTASRVVQNFLDVFSEINLRQMEHELRIILCAAEGNNYESEKIKWAFMRVKIIPNEMSLPQEATDIVK